MTDTNSQPPQSLREQLYKIAESAIEEHYDCDGGPEVMEIIAKEAAQFCKAYATEKAAAAELVGRIDELRTVRLEYGHYEATTYRNGKTMSVADRYNELTAGEGEK